MAATLSTGDVALGAVGTVTYRDGARIWAFGHSFEALGRRSLLPRGRLRVRRDLEPARHSRDRSRHLQAHLLRRPHPGHHQLGRGGLDRRNGGGPSHRHPAARWWRAKWAATAAWSRSTRSWPTSARSASAPACRSRPRSEPPRASSSCSAASGRPRSRCASGSSSPDASRSLGYCNPYFDAFTPLDDLIEAASLVDAFDLPAPRIERAAVSIRARRGREVRRADLGAGAAAGWCAGKRVRVRITLQRRSGGRRSSAFRCESRTTCDPALAPWSFRQGAGAGSAEDELPDRVRRGVRRRVRRRHPSRARSGELTRRIAAVHDGRRYLRAYPARRRASRLPLRRSELRGPAAGQAEGSPGAPLTAGSPSALVPEAPTRPRWSACPPRPRAA